MQEEKVYQVFCPNPKCSHYKKIVSVIKWGFYTTKKDNISRQRFLSKTCNCTFSETAFSGLYGKHGSFKEYEQCCKLYCYGLNTEEIADVLERDPRTISSWTVAISNKAEKFHLFNAINLIISFLQLDELWSYLKKKDKKLWLFTSIDPKSRFWLNFELGSRTKFTANKLLKGLSSMILTPKDEFIKFTTDKLSAYVHAIETNFTGKYAYLQIVKKKYKRILITVKKYLLKVVI